MNVLAKFASVTAFVWSRSGCLFGCRRIDHLLFSAVVVGSLVSGGWAAPPAGARPNIVFLLADDQCTYSLGCYGTPGVKTPHLDQLARDGMAFDRHYVTTAICMASRATIMTGLFEYKAGCNFEHGPLLQEHWQRSYPMLLRSAGYSTAIAGKFGFVVSDQPGTPGELPADDFDAWGGGPGQTFYETAKNKSMARYAADYPHSTLSYGAFAADYIREAANGKKPFCLSISFKAPHQPVRPDPRFDHVYADATFVKPANFGRRYGEHFSKQSRQGRQYQRFHSWGYSADYDRTMALYYQQIYAIDVAVGMIRDALRDANVADNTVVIYTSDNGFLCGAHGYGSKVLPYEEASRVPLIMFDPRHSRSGSELRCSSLTGNVDIAPTILGLAGIAATQPSDGKDLMQLYGAPTDTIHESLPLINVWGPKKVHSLGVVTKDWKFIYWPYSGDGFQPTEELYRLEHDPLELTNLAANPATDDALSQMRKRYDDRVEDWRQHAVPYHNYQKFSDLFRRK